jgi:hypothetical protein
MPGFLTKLHCAVKVPAVSVPLPMAVPGAGVCGGLSCPQCLCLRLCRNVQCRKPCTNEFECLHQCLKLVLVPVACAYCTCVVPVACVGACITSACACACCCLLPVIHACALAAVCWICQLTCHACPLRHLCLCCACFCVFPELDRALLDCLCFSGFRCRMPLPYALCRVTGSKRTAMFSYDGVSCLCGYCTANR